MSAVENWISEHVEGLRFCDIGGIGVGAKNERASIAYKSGASKVAMIDYRERSFVDWRVFREKMEEKGIEGVCELGGLNLADPEFPDHAGQWDFVHSTGIIYHAPNPMIMLENLAKVAQKYLIVNTVTVPEVIENEAGRLEFPGSQIVFLPGIGPRERAVFEAHYQGLLGWKDGTFSAFAPESHDVNARMPWRQLNADSSNHYWGDRGELSFSPYWTLFTPQAFRAAVTLLGFRVIDEHSFRGHTTTLFCEKE